MSEGVIYTGYSPRPLQVELHESLRRFNVFLMHRRFGKSVFAINHLIDRTLKCNLKNPRGGYIAPTFGQARRVAWQYMKDYTGNIPGVEYNEADLRVTFPHTNAQIYLLSGENPAVLKGIYLDNVVLDEYGDMNPTVWTEAVRPTLSDRHGSAIFIGTVRGTNAFWELYQYALTSGNPEWYAKMFKASETGIISDIELRSARDTMSEAEYEQEYECDPLSGLVGAYFSREMGNADKEKRITELSYDPSFEVETAFDLGVNDATSIWFFQNIRGQVRFIDYYEINGASLPEIISDLRKKPYVYGDALLPHDARARDLSTGKSQEQVFRNLGFRRTRVIPRVGTKRESIDAARRLLKVSWFDRDKCAKGIKALQNYRTKFDSKNNVMSNSPLHDWSSNASDAFQCAAMGLRIEGTRDAEYEDRVYHRESELVSETQYSPFGGRS